MQGFLKWHSTRAFPGTSDLIIAESRAEWMQGLAQETLLFWEKYISIPKFCIIKSVTLLLH